MLCSVKRLTNRGAMGLSTTLVAWVIGALALPAMGADEDNPFRRIGNGAPAAVAMTDPDLEALQFSGLTTIGDVRSFNFTDNRTRRSFWIPLGGSENGITVESYDEASEQVVVRRGQRTRTIALRKAVLVAVPVPGPSLNRPAMPVAAATPAAAPGSGVDEIKNPKTPEEVKQAEYEARMLVSDLLDISMKAREEQRKLREAQQRGQAPQSSRQ